jgi:hypothetical protein
MPESSGGKTERESEIMEIQIQILEYSVSIAHLGWWHFVGSNTFVPLDGLALVSTHGMLDISICWISGSWIFEAELRPHWRPRGVAHLAKKLHEDLAANQCYQKSTLHFFVVDSFLNVSPSGVKGHAMWPPCVSYNYLKCEATGLNFCKGRWLIVRTSYLMG